MGSWFARTQQWSNNNRIGLDTKYSSILSIPQVQHGFSCTFLLSPFWFMLIYANRGKTFKLCLGSPYLILNIWYGFFWLELICLVTRSYYFSYIRCVMWFSIYIPWAMNWSWNPKRCMSAIQALITAGINFLIPLWKRLSLLELFRKCSYWQPVLLFLRNCDVLSLCLCFVHCKAAFSTVYGVWIKMNNVHVLMKTLVFRWIFELLHHKALVLGCFSE